MLFVCWSSSNRYLRMSFVFIPPSLPPSLPLFLLSQQRTPLAQAASGRLSSLRTEEEGLKSRACLSTRLGMSPRG
jgi:hypothetical protein